jgi:hypothetical protein
VGEMKIVNVSRETSSDNKVVDRNCRWKNKKWGKKDGFT